MVISIISSWNFPRTNWLSAGPLAEQFIMFATPYLHNTYRRWWPKSIKRWNGSPRLQSACAEAQKCFIQVPQVSNNAKRKHLWSSLNPSNLANAVCGFMNLTPFSYSTISMRHVFKIHHSKLHGSNRYWSPHSVPWSMQDVDSEAVLTNNTLVIFCTLKTFDGESAVQLVYWLLASFYWMITEA